MKQDDRTYFKDVGIKSSDCYYVNDDKVEARKLSLRGGSRTVAAQLNDEHNTMIENRHKKMQEQAQNRLAELEKMKQDEIEGRNKQQ